MPKGSSGKKVKVPNGCWFHNIAVVKAPKNLEIMVTYPVWQIIVHKAKGPKISGFHKAKNSIVEPMCEHIHNMRGKGLPVLKLGQNNAVKNKKLVKRLKCKDWKLDVEVECTARDTPQ